MNVKLPPSAIASVGGGAGPHKTLNHLKKSILLCHVRFIIQSDLSKIYWGSPRNLSIYYREGICYIILHIVYSAYIVLGIKCIV